MKKLFFWLLVVKAGAKKTSAEYPRVITFKDAMHSSTALLQCLIGEPNDR
jgi:hypothetical protein